MAPDFIIEMYFCRDWCIFMPVFNPVWWSGTSTNTADTVTNANTLDKQSFPRFHISYNITLTKYTLMNVTPRCVEADVNLFCVIRLKLLGENSMAWYITITRAMLATKCFRLYGIWWLIQIRKLWSICWGFGYFRNGDYIDVPRLYFYWNFGRF